MKTFPDFTWEWITGICETQRDTATELLKLYPNSHYDAPLINAEALLALVSKLQEHPHLVRLVPMKSLMTLVWFPAEDCRVDLSFNQRNAAYIIEIVSGNDVTEEKTVTLDNAADEIYAYITKLRDD